MDTAIKDGDFKLNSRGYPIRIDGDNELLQQVIIRLLCKKGSFEYNTQLGSELYKLKSIYSTEDEIKKKALEYAKEAIKNMKSVEVKDVKITSGLNPDRLSLSFFLELNNTAKEIEIEV